jgi:hypothetical protein
MTHYGIPNMHPLPVEQGCQLRRKPLRRGLGRLLHDDAATLAFFDALILSDDENSAEDRGGHRTT